MKCESTALSRTSPTVVSFREEIVTEDIPEQYKQESEDRRRDLIGKIGAASHVLTENNFFVVRV